MSKAIRDQDGEYVGLSHYLKMENVFAASEKPGKAVKARMRALQREGTRLIAAQEARKRAKAKAHAIVNKMKRDAS